MSLFLFIFSGAVLFLVFVQLVGFLIRKPKNQYPIMGYGNTGTKKRKGDGYFYGDFFDDSGHSTGGWSDSDGGSDGGD